MLVLSRKINEGVILGGDVKVVVLAIEGDKVKLGIEAPKSVRIYREELIRQTEDMNKLAAKSAMVRFELPK